MQPLADGFDVPMPCGHEDDSVRVHATGGIVGYCSRCERAYELTMSRMRKSDAGVALGVSAPA